MFVSNIIHCVDTYEQPKYNKLYFTYWEHVCSSSSHCLGICNGGFFLIFLTFTFCTTVSEMISPAKISGKIQIYQQIACGISSGNTQGEPQQTRVSSPWKYLKYHLSSPCIQEARIQIVFLLWRITANVMFLSRALLPYPGTNWKMQNICFVGAPCVAAGC